MKLKRLDENYNEVDVLEWMKKNCTNYIGANHLTFDQKGVKINSSVTFEIVNPPNFKITKIDGDIKISRCTIEDFSWLPDEIIKDFNITDCTITSFKGFPKAVNGYFEISRCNGFRSLADLTTHFGTSMTFYDLKDLESLECYNVTYSKGGLLIRDCPIKSLAGLPKLIDPKDCAWIHIKDTTIKDLVGLPNCISYLTVKSPSLQSIEGVPFHINSLDAESVEDCVKIESKNETVNKAYETYCRILNEFPLKPKESRSDYISRVFKDNPEMSTFLTNEEIPKEYSGASIIKRLGAF